MKIIDIKIGSFNRYLILLIVFLFTYLFYLSVPAFYNYEKLQKNLTFKLSEDFKLNATLLGSIEYRILPSPNFEISNVILKSGNDKNAFEFAVIKKMKVFIPVKKIYDQDQLKIKKIIFYDSNFNINKKSFKYIKSYLKEEISKKKIKIKKSMFFFRDSESKKDAVALSHIQSLTLFYDKKNDYNKIKLIGSIFNTKYDLIFLKNNIKNLSNFNLNFKKINTKFSNKLFDSKKEKNSSNGEALLFFLGSEIKIKYDIKDQIFIFVSDNLYINQNNIKFNGKINFSPFNYYLNIQLDDIDGMNLINIITLIQNLFKKNILLNKNFNGKILININYLDNIILFDSARIHLEFINGKLKFTDTTFLSNKIGKLHLLDGQLVTLNNTEIFKSKFLFKINDIEKFYRKFQIPKKKRKKIKNIFFEIEKNLDNQNFNILKFGINAELKNNVLVNFTDLTNIIDVDKINKLKNWIELKKISNELFSQIS